MRRCPLVMAMTATTTATKSNVSTMIFSRPTLPGLPSPPKRRIDMRKWPRSVNSWRNASGMRETMPAMMMRLMPLPMPYSSICSPIHMRKIVPAVIMMTAGTIFLMWIGEQIDEYGIGNGISLIIMAGIVSRIPDAFLQLFTERGHFRMSILRLGGDGNPGSVGLEKIIVLTLLFVAVVVAVIAITKGQRRIPTQSAKHVRGRRVYGGTRQFLPLRINAAGVMPVIFASSLLLIPLFALRYFAQRVSWPWLNTVASSFERQGYL